MPKILPSGLAAEKDKEENKPLHLFDIEINDTLTIHLIRRETALIFDGTTYEPFNIVFDAIQQNTSGRLSVLRVIAGNVNLQIGAFLRLNNALRKRRVVIRQIDSALAINPAEVFTVFTGFVRDADTDERKVVLNCTSRLESLNVQIPGRTYSRTKCGWKRFDDDGVTANKRFCGWKRFVNRLNPAYPGARDDFCDKTPFGASGCDAHFNLSRNGGFRDMGRSDAIIV